MPEKIPQGSSYIKKMAQPVKQAAPFLSCLLRRHPVFDQDVVLFE